MCRRPLSSAAAGLDRRLTRFVNMEPTAWRSPCPADLVPVVEQASGARLGTDDPLRGEWNVIAVGPHQAAALVARDLGDTGAEPDRRFDFAVTHDRALVVEAARSLLRCLTPVRAAAEPVAR